MKAFYAIVFALISFVGVQAQITAFPTGGSLEKDSLAQVRELDIFLKQGDRVLLQEVANVRVSNRAELESFFQSQLHKAALRVVTTEVAGQDRSLPYSIVAFALQYYWDDHDEDGIINYFQVPGVQFSLVKMAAGYTLPDLSGVKMEFPRRIGHTFNHLKWIGVTASRGDDVIFNTDSNQTTENAKVVEIIHRSGISYVFIATELVLDKDVTIQIRTLSSSSTGDLVFQAFEQGQELEVPPLSLSLVLYPPVDADGKKSSVEPPPSPQALLRGHGGMVGMFVQYQMSSDLVNWIDFPNGRFPVTPAGVQSFTDKSTARSHLFYRLRLVE